MNYFSEIPGGTALLSEDGVFSEVKLAERGGMVYACCKDGYVMLFWDNSTSHKKVQWHSIDAEGLTFREMEGGRGIKYYCNA